MQPPQWQVQVFYDGDCPLCRREIALLRRLDRKQRVWFTDIADPEFRAEEWGITLPQLMDEIHLRRRDGTWVRGVEAFRLLYQAVGFGWLVPITRLPGIRQGLDAGYRVFAKNRLKWTGRCTDTCAIEPRNSSHSAEVHPREH